MTRRGRKILWLATAVYAAALMTASLLPSGEGPLGGWDAALTPAVQDALHLPAYMGLVILVAAALATHVRLTAARIAWIALACVGLGALMEFAQAFIPGRTCSLKDGLVNAAGAVLGCSATWVWRRFRGGWSAPASHDASAHQATNTKPRVCMLAARTVPNSHVRESEEGSVREGGDQLDDRGHGVIRRPSPKIASILCHHRTQGTDAPGVHIRGMANGFRHCVAEVDVIGPPGTSVEIDKAPQKDARGAGRGLKRMLGWLSAAAPEWLFEVVGTLYNASALFRLLRATSGKRYDLIYERYALFLVAGVLVARIRHVPIVVEVNDSVMIVRSRPLCMKYLAKRIEAWVLKNATLVVTVSQPFKRLLLQHGLGPDQVLVVPNAVDPHDWTDPGEADDAKGPRRDGPVVIGCVAAFVDWHRPDFLVESVAELLRRGQARLLLIGDGPARESAEATARRLRCADRVEFTGFINHAEVRRRLAEVDIAVMAHSNEHGSPMKIFEYMAAGKAIVAPDCEPIREVIQDGQTGLLFPPLCAGALHRKLGELVSDGVARCRLGRNARERVFSLHTWQRNAERVLAALRMREVAWP